MLSHYGLTREGDRFVDYFPWVTAAAAVPVTLGVDAVSAVAGTPDTDALDIHNTTRLATEAQHAGILRWFEHRQVQVRASHEAVDTSGFFDDIKVWSAEPAKKK